MQWPRDDLMSDFTDEQLTDGNSFKRLQTRIRELEKEKRGLAKSVLLFIKQGSKNRQAYDYPEYLRIITELEQIIKEGEDE